MWNERLKRIEKALMPADEKGGIVMIVAEEGDGIDDLFVSKDEEDEYIKEKAKECDVVEISAENIEQWRREKSQHNS